MPIYNYVCDRKHVLERLVSHRDRESRVKCNCGSDAFYRVLPSFARTTEPGTVPNDEFMRRLARASGGSPTGGAQPMTLSDKWLR